MVGGGERDRALEAFFLIDRRLKTGSYAGQQEAIAALPAFLGAWVHLPDVVGSALLRTTNYICGCLAGAAALDLARLAVAVLCASAALPPLPSGHSREIVRRLSNAYDEPLAGTAARCLVVRLLVLFSYDRDEDRTNPLALYRVSLGLLEAEADDELVEASIAALDGLMSGSRPAEVPLAHIAPPAMRLIAANGTTWHCLEALLRTIEAATVATAADRLAERAIFDFFVGLLGRSPAGEAAIEEGGDGRAWAPRIKAVIVALSLRRFDLYPAAMEALRADRARPEGGGGGERGPERTLRLAYAYHPMTLAKL